MGWWATAHRKSLPQKKAQGAAVSELSAKVFEALQKHGPLSKTQLQEHVGRESSQAALDRALAELWSILKITRVDYSARGGASWDVLYRWAPEPIKEGINISVPEAVTALVSKYLETAIAVEQDDIEQFFSHLTSRSKVREAVGALLQARELSLVTIGTKEPDPPDATAGHATETQLMRDDSVAGAKSERQKTGDRH